MSAEALHDEVVCIAAAEQLDALDGDILIQKIGKKGFMILRLMGMISPCGCVDGHTIYAF